MCSEVEDREDQYSELKKHVKDRKYKPSLVIAAIRRARAIPRAQALKRVVPPTQSNRHILRSLTTLDCQTCSICRESTGGQWFKITT